MKDQGRREYHVQEINHLNPFSDVWNTMVIREDWSER